MSFSQEIRQIMYEGPATAIEVAALLEITDREARKIIARLRERDHVQLTQETRQNPGTGRRRLKVYALTPRGRHFTVKYKNGYHRLEKAYPNKES